MRKSVEELKNDFTVAAYETITKQLQQTDRKVSLIISWDSVMAVMLGRESFMSGLGATALSFGFLVILIGIVSVRLSLIG